jgi:hypothetical protein
MLSARQTQHILDHLVIVHRWFVVSIRVNIRVFMRRHLRLGNMIRRNLMLRNLIRMQMLIRRRLLIIKRMLLSDLR